MIYKFHRLIGCHKRTGRILKKLEKIVSRYSTEDTDVWCNHGNWQGKLEYAQKEQYGNGSEAVFEGITVRIPEKYDQYLKQKYGDYTKDPEQKEGHHFCFICDLGKSYRKYINKKL